MTSPDSSGSMAARPKLVATAAVASLLISVASICIFFFMSNYENEKNANHLDDVINTSFLSQEDNTNSTSIINNHPADHDSLIPLQASDIVGFLCAALGLILAAGGGIGGGGILVPIYILILGFLPKHAIPLSNVTVFGGAIANTMRNWSKRHPTADRPLIDWDLIVVMEPPTLAGALVGANLNKMLPETVVAVLLVLLLSFTSYNTLKKAQKMHQKETEEIKRQNIGTRTVEVDSTTMMSNSKFVESNHEYLLLNDDDTPSSSSEDEADLLDNYDPVGLSLHNIDNISHHPSQSRHAFSDLSSVQLNDDGEGDEEDRLDSFEDLPEFGNPVTIDDILDEERHPKRRNVLLIVGMFLVVLLINILKGGKSWHAFDIIEILHTYH